MMKASGLKMMQTDAKATGMEILPMSAWKSKVLNSVAWILGFRGEYVACVTFNFDYTDLNELEKRVEELGK